MECKQPAISQSLRLSDPIKCIKTGIIALKIPNDEIKTIISSFNTVWQKIINLKSGADEMLRYSFRGLFQYNLRLLACHTANSFLLSTTLYNNIITRTKAYKNCLYELDDKNQKNAAKFCVLRHFSAWVRH